MSPPLRSIVVSIIGAVLLCCCALLPLLGPISMTRLLLKEQRWALQKVLWGCIIWFLPVVGPPLYLLLGHYATGRWCHSRAGVVPPLLVIGAFFLLAILLLVASPPT